MSIDPWGVPAYPTAAPWAEWIDVHMRCQVRGPRGRCQLVVGHEQPHAVVVQVAIGKRAWRWLGDERHGAGGAHEVDGWLDDGGPWGNVATDRAPWIPGWP